MSKSTNDQSGNFAGNHAGAAKEDGPRFVKVHPYLTRRFSLSRSKIYDLMDSGKLRSVKIGTSRRVPIDAVEEFEAELMATGSI